MHLEIYVHVYQDLDFRKKLNDVLFFSFFLKESYFFYSKVWKQLHIQINVIFQSHLMFISIESLLKMEYHDTSLDSLFIFIK